jgi:hypothetical protein
MIHLREKDLLRYVLHSSDVDFDPSLKRHVLSCLKCRKSTASLSKKLFPRQKFKTPSKAVLSRIVDTYEKISIEKIPFYATPLFKKYAPVAAVFSILLTAGLIAYSMSNESTQMVTQSVKGSATANSRKLVEGKVVNTGFLVITGKESQLALEGKSVRLKAGSDTSIIIKKAIIDKKTGKTVFDLVIDRGSVSASFDQDTILKSTLRTPHVKIVSREGSRIVLSVDGEKTQVVVKQGNASLSPTEGKEVVQVEEGYGYTISGSKEGSASKGVSSSIEQHEISLSDDDDDDVDVDLGSLFIEN